MSNLKSETARINGAKSHGPKSPETLAISSQNALKHGLTSRHSTLLRCENAAEFQEFIAACVTAYRPTDNAQQFMVNEMISARWRIRRIRIVETALIDLEMTDNQAATEKKYNQPDSGIHMAVAFRTIIEDSRSLSLVSRYESRLVRLHDRAYRTLRELQKFTPQQAAPMDPVPDPVPSNEVALDPAATAHPPLQNDETNPPKPCARKVKTPHSDNSKRVYVPVRRSQLAVAVARLAAHKLLRRK